MNFVMGLAHHGCLCGSVEEHQSMEKSKGPRQWGPRNFSLFDTHDKTKNTFLNISLPNSKTYHLPYSIKSYLGKTVTKSD